MKLAVGLVLAVVAVVAVSAGDPATLSTKEEATKTTKATKSTKTGTASGSGIGSLFEDGSTGAIGDESGETDTPADPKLVTRIGITVPMGSKLDLGIGPAVVPSGSGSWDWNWDSVEGSGSGHYDCDTVCPTDFEPVCGSDNVTYTNDCAFVVAQCNTTALVVANSGECDLGSASASASTGASAAGSSAESCPDACTMEYSPVTDENGVVYSNECMMKIAKCKGDTGEKKKTVDFSDLLDEDTSDPTLVKGVKETEAPVEAATKTTKATKSEKTGTASSSGIGSLFEDGSTGLIGDESASGSADPTLVKGVKETGAQVEAATKTTKATKSEKTGTASSSGIGSLFEDGSTGLIGDESASGSADPTLVKGVKETGAQVEAATKTTKATKSEKTGTASSSGIGSLFEDGSTGLIGEESASGSADPTLVKGVKETGAKVEAATKTTKATKSEKTGTASSSGIGSLFEDGSTGLIGDESASGSADPTLVKGVKETGAQVEAATKTTKATKSEKTGTASSSGIGSLFEDGSTGLIGDESASGSADPTLVKGVKETGAKVEAATKTTKATKSEKTGTASSSGIGSLFEDGSTGLIGEESASGSADPTLVKGVKEQEIVPASTTTKIVA